MTFVAGYIVGVALALFVLVGVPLLLGWGRNDFDTAAKRGAWRAT